VAKSPVVNPSLRRERYPVAKSPVDKTVDAWRIPVAKSPRLPSNGRVRCPAAKSPSIAPVSARATRSGVRGLAEENEERASIPDYLHNL
jgi:hypothetical protein